MQQTIGFSTSVYAKVVPLLEEPMDETAILPLTVVRSRGRWEVRLAGRLIRIRTRAGTWMLARFETREAAEGYRWLLVGSDLTNRPVARELS